MSLELQHSTQLLPLTEVRRRFSEALQQQLKKQGPVTEEQLLRLKQSRKHLPTYRQGVIQKSRPSSASASKSV